MRAGAARIFCVPEASSSSHRDSAVYEGDENRMGINRGWCVTSTALGLATMAPPQPSTPRQ